MANMNAQRQIAEVSEKAVSDFAPHSLAVLHYFGDLGYWRLPRTACVHLRSQLYQNAE